MNEIVGAVVSYFARYVVGDTVLSLVVCCGIESCTVCDTMLCLGQPFGGRSTECKEKCFF